MRASARTGRTYSIAAAAFAIVTVLAADVRAEKSVKHPYPAVKVIQQIVDLEDGLKVKFHAAIVDLSRPEVQVVVSPPKYRGMRTSKFAKAMGAQVALNGGFWKLVSKDPMGWVVSAGRPWPDALQDDRMGYLAISKEGKAWIQPPGPNPIPAADEGYMVISGMPLLVDEGRVGPVRGCGYVCMEHPRSAVGVSEDGWKLFLAVSEGRVEGSTSIKPAEMSKFLIGLGAWRALNLDGGGSSTLYVESLGGMLNAPAEGMERSVINHIGIILGGEKIASEAGGPAEPAPEQGAGPEHAPELHESITFTDEDFVPLGEVENPPRLGQAMVAGAALLLMLLGSAAGLAVVLVRRKRRRS